MPGGIEDRKVLSLTSRFLGGYGVSLVVQQQIKGLVRNGWRHLAVAASDLSEDGQFDGVPLLRVREDKGSTQTLIRRVRPDIVLVHTPPFYASVGDYSAPHLIKIACDYGEPFPSFFDETTVREEIDRNKYAAIRKFHAHTSISDFIRRTAGIKNSIVNYLGADHMLQDGPDEIVPFDVRKRLGLSPKAFIISTLSRLGSGESRYKGFDLLAATRAALQRKLPGMTFVFLLCGKIAPGGESVRQEFSQAGFHVLTDLTENEKRSVFQQSDLYFSASLWEGFDLPLVEAQILGTPAVAFSTGAHVEVCPFHFLDIAELVEHVAALAQDQDLRQWSGQTCQTFVKNKFIWARHTDVLMDLLLKTNHEPLQFETEPVEVRSDAMNKRVLVEHLQRLGQEGTVENGLLPGTYRVRYAPSSRPLVSIIIPNREHADLLDRCVLSVLQRSTYNPFEILIIENGSTRPETFSCYERLRGDSRIKLLSWSRPFNSSLVNNFGVEQGQGEILVFMNNDIEVITPDWIESMLEHARRREVGMVGAKLHYPDHTIQHAGVIVGIRGVADHSHRNFPGNRHDYMGCLSVIRNVSAVTGACAMIRKQVFHAVGGFDENFPVAFNDVDLCMKLRAQDYLVVWTPFVEMVHHKLVTRGREDSREKQDRSRRERDYFRQRWKRYLATGDPYYNPNLTLLRKDF